MHAQVHWFLRAEDSKMVLIFGGGFDAPQTPSMAWGDEDSAEKSKAPDPSLVDASDSGGKDSHGDMGRCAIFTLMLFCHLPNLNGKIPLAMQTGQTPDISKFTLFHFWQVALVESHRKDMTEELTHWRCPAKGVGDELTHMVLLTELEKLVPNHMICDNEQFSQIVWFEK